MNLSEEMKEVVKNAPYCTLVTIGEDGMPHPIIVGGKEQAGESITIGIYKMEQTQKNLAANPKAWITVATLDGGPVGFRFKGSAAVQDKKVVFVPDSADRMI